jgi:UDP-glucose 4-epimerase
MKVLVTGGAGFIGSHLVSHFQGKAEVRVLDNLETGYRRNLDGLETDFINGSVTDRSIVGEAVDGVDYIFHMAALISVPESMEKPEEYEEVNTGGTRVLLEEAARAGVKKLCFSSSAAIYGDNPVVPKVEDMEPEPKSPYAVNKLDGEVLCNRFKKEGRLDTACLRYFNVFGPRQDPGSAYAAAIPVFVDRALRNAPVTVFGDGQQTRDFVYVKDVVAANVHLATNPTEPGCYNVGYGKSITINDLARAIIRMMGSASSLEHVPPRPGDVKHSLASVERLASTGFKPVADFDKGLQATIEYFLAR